ncbi:amino acid permease [Nisaea acidiphila]|uniref:Amino acid permease n=1 Tax=Nisaea acidiphila TaxID=1862145 RepID=A0A9J7AVC8_9PROT|nr:amino acid permease [Nisaea acidiphila]UUX51070.1 amino acid permease [Nisaea acidiphila]
MPEPTLKRSLSLPLVVLYGLGVTIGAGIYVLLGASAGRAGIHAPVAFLLAATAVLFSAISFAEMARRYPVSAGEAAYVQAGFGLGWLSTLVGLLVVAAGTISCATIALGSTGYIREFLDLPASTILLAVILLLGAIAAWGITESVLVAGLFTIVEIGALLAVIVAGLWTDPGIVTEIPKVLPAPGDAAALTGILSATLLCFFAFIGFEDIVNLAEEVKQPDRTLPRAIFITLALAALLYFSVTAIAVLSVPLDELAASPAPMSLVFERVSGLSPWTITLIAIVATLNGVVVQIVMASRVLYGLARQGSIPAVLGRVNRVTQTPLLATSLVIAIILVLALAFPLEPLAEMTSRIVLTTFTLVNASLLRLHLRDGALRRIWLPAAGCLTCLALLFGTLR